MMWRSCLLTLLLLGLAPFVRAESMNFSNLTCPDANMLGAGMFNKICWNAMFPIRMAGVTVWSGDNWTPENTTTRSLCACGGDLSAGKLPVIGTTVGMWMPTRLYEVTRRPYCLPSMGGLTLSSSVGTAGGEMMIGGTQSPTSSVLTKHQSIYHVHAYYYPLMAMLKVMDVPMCNPDQVSSFDVAQMSEAYPNWYDDELALLLSPEMLLYASPIGIAAQPIDCVAATANDRPIQRLHWVVGCWGNLYPSNGTLGSNSSPVTSSSLLAMRFLNLITRVGMVKKSVGDDAYCGDETMWVLDKQQYRMQMAFPIPEARDMETPPGTINSSGIAEVDPSSFMGNKCSHGLGVNTLKWGEWRTTPGTGEDFVYVLWQWMDCCVGFLGP